MAHKETPRGCYNIPFKKSQIILDAALNTTHINKAHRSVVDVMKNRKSEGDAATTANNVCLEQACNK